MLCLPGRKALSWATLLLLLGFQLLLIPAWHFQIGKEGNEENSLALYFPATVEFALHTFNEQSKDKYAYRLDHILNSSREELDYHDMVFSMKLKLRKTTCGKHDEDIDNCPFQDGPALNNTITCSFIVSTQPWDTKFKLLYRTCSKGVP
ncbi:cystatin-9-like [Castor canadensis]|uniref:Cystatin-9-like n=1 Tax=Castor canadensis TaxID=51338 RepID=A0A8B7W9Y7_CASCN